MVCVCAVFIVATWIRFKRPVNVNKTEALAQALHACVFKHVNVWRLKGRKQIKRTVGGISH